jgi:hypothetical protein
MNQNPKRISYFVEMASVGKDANPWAAIESKVDAGMAEIFYRRQKDFGTHVEHWGLIETTEAVCLELDNSSNLFIVEAFQAIYRGSTDGNFIVDEVGVPVERESDVDPLFVQLLRDNFQIL